MSSKRTFVAISSSSRLSLSLSSSIVVEQLDDVLVAPIAEGAQERRGEEFAAAVAAVEINVKQVVRVELHFEPGAAVRDDAEAVRAACR